MEKGIQINARLDLAVRISDIASRLTLAMLPAGERLDPDIVAMEHETNISIVLVKLEGLMSTERSRLDALIALRNTHEQSAR